MGNTYRYTYDLAGNKTGETNAKGYSMTYAYDKLNRLITVTDPYNTVVTTNSYDANGNLIETKEAKGYTTLYAYDLAGRVVKITDPEAVLKNGFTESYEYNQYGEKTKITDGLGNTTSYSYDKAGRLERVTDSLQITTQYTYDKAGNKLTMTDGRGKTTRYGYGAFGLLRTLIDADDRTMSYAYDLAGNTAGITNRNGNLTLFIYDNRNLITEKISANTGESIAYGYDAAGNRTAMQDESGSYTYAYDKNNRITEIRKGGSMQLTYTYDATGNIEIVTDSKGHATGYTYDKSGRMETVTFEGKTTTYAYEINGNQKSVTYEVGVKEEYSYARNNRLLTLSNKKSNGTVISQYSYTYDITGKETSKTDSYGKTNYTYDRAGRITRVEAPGKTTVYAYDNAGNRLSLLETYASNQSSGFVDGDTGEAIEYMVKTSRYFYSNTNQLLKLAEEMSNSSAKVLLEKTTDYLYDENGNQLAETTSFLRPTGGTLKKSIRGSVHGESQPTAPDALMERTNNTFDGFNRLKAVEKIEDGIRTSVEYTYNGDDLRTRKVVKSSDNSYTPETTSFLYDRQHVILETNEAGTVKTRYVRGINYIAQYNNGESGSNAQELSYFLFNGHGDTVQTVSSTGDIQNQYDYDIFGNPTLTIETAACSIRYAGEYLDNETGLYYLRARYYDPYTGRFISEDSYWGEDNNPLSLNLYTYAYNNPVRFVDPTGHNAERIDQLVGYIDANKEIWWMAQNNANLTAEQRKKVQDAAHANAERFRAELAELEKGNKTVEDLVRLSGDDAGTWEEYSKSVTKNQAQANPGNDYSTVLKQQEKDCDIAVAFGINAKGISSDDIQNNIQTNIEAYAKAILDVSKADKSKAITSNVTINGISTGNAKTYSGVTTGNLRDIVTALGGKVNWDSNTGVATIEIQNKDTDMWEKITYDTKTMINGIGIASDGTPFTAIGGRLQVGVRHMAQIAGVEDAISWRTDNGTPMVTIQTDMKNSPVQVTRAGNKVDINAYVKFSGDAVNDYFPGEVIIDPSTGAATGLTYATVAKNTIESKWSGMFGVYGQDVSVKAQVHTEWVNNNQRFLTYNINYRDEYSHAGTIPSIFIAAMIRDEGIAWDMKYSCDRITVNVDKNRLQEYTYTDAIKSAFAHEFGHALGIGDAYNAWYRDKPNSLGLLIPSIETILGQPTDGKAGYWAPKQYVELESGTGQMVFVPDNDIMLGRGANNVNVVTSNNIRMVLEAYRKNRPVFYPGSSKWFVDRGTDPIELYNPYEDIINPAR